MASFDLTYQVALSSYSVKLIISSVEQDDRISLKSVVIFLIQDLGRRCMSEKGAMIGHIKGFGKDKEGGYIKVSHTGQGIPVSCEGSIDDVSGPVEFTINAHLLGVSADRVETLLLETITTLVNQGEVMIDTVPRKEP